MALHRGLAVQHEYQVAALLPPTRCLVCCCCPRPAGGDLYKRLVRAGGVLSEGEVARDVVVPLLLTLTFLHANNIVHR